MIYSCIVQKHQLRGYEQPGLLSLMAFADPAKLHWHITGSVGSNNQNWLCARLLPMAVSKYPVDSVYSYLLLRTQHYLYPNGSEVSPSACPPTFTLVLFWYTFINTLGKTQPFFCQYYLLLLYHMLDDLLTRYSILQ